jgi:hypothetical protein
LQLPPQGEESKHMAQIRVEFPNSKGEADEVKDEAAKGEGRLTAFWVAPAKARIMQRARLVIDENHKLIPDPLGPEAQAISYNPLVLRLNKWAVPRYLRVWQWTRRSNGCSMMGGLLSTAIISVSESR